MIGLGLNATKTPTTNTNIVKSVDAGGGERGSSSSLVNALVLRHDYKDRPVEPVSSGAVYLNGAGDDDYIAISGPYTGMNIGGGKLSLSCWVNVKSITEGTTRWIAGKADGASVAAGNSEGYGLYLGNGGTLWSFFVSDGTQSAIAAAATSVVANQWYHLCATFNGTTSAQLYVNGVLATTATVSGGASLGNVDVSDDFKIGKLTSTGTTHNGYICNVGVWKGIVLTQPQVKSIMYKDYAGLSASEKTGLSSWWNLDSVIDSADIKDGDTTVYDNHHGGSDTLGSELVTSYEVTESDTTGKWTAYGTSTLTSNNNILTSTIGGGSDGDNEGAKYEMTSVAGYTAGKTYKVEADIWLGTYVPNPTNQFKIYLGGVQQAITLSTTQTTFTAYITTSDTSDLMIYQNDADDTEGTFFISNVSVKLVNGNTGTLS